MTRQQWIVRAAGLSLKRQCVLAGVSRATVYARRQPKVVDESEALLLGLIDQEYTRHPFYGSRKMVVYLGKCGHSVNRKRVQRLMRSLGLAGRAPGPNTSRAHPPAQGLPVLAAWRGCGQAQSGVEHGHHPHPPGQRLCVFGGDHRLSLSSVFGAASSTRTCTSMATQRWAT